jgi:hypothetical protein
MPPELDPPVVRPPLAMPDAPLEPLAVPVPELLPAEMLPEPEPPVVKPPAVPAPLPPVASLDPDLLPTAPPLAPVEGSWPPSPTPVVTTPRQPATVRQAQRPKAAAPPLRKSIILLKKTLDVAESFKESRLSSRSRKDGSTASLKLGGNRAEVEGANLGSRRGDRDCGRRGSG